MQTKKIVYFLGRTHFIDCFLDKNKANQKGGKHYLINVHLGEDHSIEIELKTRYFKLVQMKPQ